MANPTQIAELLSAAQRIEAKLDKAIALMEALEAYSEVDSSD